MTELLFQRLKGEGLVREMETDLYGHGHTVLRKRLKGEGLVREMETTAMHLAS